MISKRLKTIAELVTDGSSVADIGTDHGYVPIYLLQNNMAKKVIAVDLSKGSLEKALYNAKRAGIKILNENFMDDIKSESDLSDFSNEGPYVEFRLSDGLSDIVPGEAGCIIISGVGGILTVNILSEGEDVLKQANELILSPHRDAELVRKFIKNKGFDIVCDEEMTDKKKTYTIIKAIRRPQGNYR